VTGGPRPGPGSGPDGPGAGPGAGSGGWGGAEDWSRAGWRAHLPGVADPGALVEELGAETIPALAAASARREPDRIAVAVDGDACTHAELDAGAALVAGWLAGRLAPGDRVLLAATSSLGFLHCYLGALRAGAVVVLANPGYTAAELGHLVSDSGAAIAFADAGPAQRLAGLAAPPLTVPVQGPPGGWGGTPDPVIRARPQDAALLAYTSGTTGRPKGVPLTHRQLAVSIRSAMAAWRWTAGDVLVHALPLFHQHGLGGVHATLIAGSTARIQSRFAAAELIETVRASGATVLFAVPTIYRELLNAREAQPPAGPTRPGPGRPGPLLPGLRLAVCGSAPLSPALAAELPGLLGGLPLVRYGTTESGLDVANPVDDRRGDTVGLPLPGVLVRVWSGGAEAPAGTDGEIQLRGPQVFDGYWRDPAATEAAFTGDGWFRTGDIGAVDPGSGHLVIRGRTKELIITGGLNVYPREVEVVLEGHPSVAEAAVGGVPHERWGEQVTAWVVMRPGGRFDEDALMAHARTALAAYKCPKRIVQRGSLPRNQLGKIVRAALTAPGPAAGPRAGAAAGTAPGADADTAPRAAAGAAAGAGSEAPAPPPQATGFGRENQSSA
jgi:acyl-CoA synthetase (AMP-forming)/AMP-acid ligase II